MSVRVYEGITLVIIPVEQYFKKNISLISNFSKKGYEIIYVTSNKPFKILNEVFKKKKIENVFVIDMITKTAVNAPKKEKNVLFTNSPISLTEVSISINQLLNKLKNKKRMLFFDSLTALRIYNDESRVEKFTHFLTNKLRFAEVKAIFISVEEETDKLLIQRLSLLVDNVVKLND